MRAALVSVPMLCCYTVMNSARYNWSDILVFLAVYQSGSTLAASKQLSMSQPTVARRIDALEHALKLTLFERDTRGFKPTTAAKDLHAQATAIATAADSFAEKADTLRHTETKPIRITAPRVNFSDNFAAILSDFSAANPGVHFELISSYKVLDLVAGDADIAIRFSNKVNDDRLICTRLTTATSTLYCTKPYADRHGLPASLDDLGDHRVVLLANPLLPTPYSSKPITLNETLRQKVEPTQIATQCSEIEGVITAIMAGLGLGAVPTSLAKDHPALMPCFPPPAGTETATWLLISPEAYRHPEVKAFSAFFAPRFRAIFKPKP